MKTIVCSLLLLWETGLFAALPLAAFEFTQPGSAQGWTAQHNISSLRSTAAGLEIGLSGEDPYFQGPPRDYPADQPLWLDLRLRSDQGGGGQVFYFRDGATPTEQQSVRFDVPAGEWTEVRLELPALGPGHRFRIDPPGEQGTAVLGWMRVERRRLFEPPEWRRPAPLELRNAETVRSGDLEVAVGTAGFSMRVAGTDMGVSDAHATIGYLLEDELRWVDSSTLPSSSVRLDRLGAAVRSTLHCRETDGTEWQISRDFCAGPVPGTVDVEMQVTVSRERMVMFLPMLLLFPGAESFGTNKNQGLAAGLEYLENEPSSSEADLTGPAARRQVPASHKITFPLLTVQAGHRYLGLVWNMQPHFSAVFDSPDRLFGRGGHALGVIFPGSDGGNRPEGSLLPYFGARLAAQQPLRLRAQIIGGLGETAVAAVQHYVRLRGWPQIPQTGYDFARYARLTAQGWLDSQVREGNLFRHAVWPGFNAQPAADAAMWMDWLGARLPDTPLRLRLRQASQDALAQVAPGSYNSAAVGHVRYPAPALVYGRVTEGVTLAKAHAEGLLRRFEAEGFVPYRKSRNGLDYGRTHFAPDANGLTAQLVEVLLEAAIFSGDRGLIDQALRHLRGLGKFSHGVPRGAQTWEIPLHTPDILASAHLVRAYTLGYEWTGEGGFLEEANYWAWTGVPFVYLVNPTGRAIGPYSTIAVLGATSWTAPVWMGMPVQWCGMVYAEALARLARHDASAPWGRLADGITAAAIQISWPEQDRKRGGLLPDAFELPGQKRAGPAINPATVQAGAVRFYRQPAVYDFHVFRKQGLVVHAPGEIADRSELPAAVQFEVRGWPESAYGVLVHGFRTRPKVEVGGKPIVLDAPHEFQGEAGRLVLKLQGRAVVKITQ